IDQERASKPVTRKNHVENGPTKGSMVPVMAMEIRLLSSRDRMKHVESSNIVLAARNDHQRRRPRQPRCNLRVRAAARRVLSTGRPPRSESRVKVMYSRAPW